MAQLQQYFLQSATLNDQIIPRDWINSVLYIEKTALTGPLLRLEVRDATGSIVDEYKAAYGAKLVVETGDPTGDRKTVKETFFVTSAPAQGDVVQITAILDALKTIKTPTSAAKLFSNRQPRDILKDFAGSLTVEADTFKKAGTYHLNMGEKPSLVLSQIAADHGALVWIARGKFYVKEMARLIKTKAAMVYESNNPSAQYTISRSEHINQDFAATQDSQYRFVGYSETDGYVETGDASLPVRYVSDADMSTLKNMQQVLVPKLDIEVSGNTDITAGMVIGIQIHRYDQKNQVDESLPKNFIVERVAHYEDRISYITRMILGVPYIE